MLYSSIQVFVNHERKVWTTNYMYCTGIRKLVSKYGYSTYCKLCIVDIILNI